MRNLKKILALVLALVMSLSLMATASAADFKDASEISENYQTAVNVLEGLKVFKGYAEDNTFRPKGDITRAEVAAIIYRIATGDAEDKQAAIYTDMTTSFADLGQAQWARGYVNYCHNAQIIKGESATKFNPNGKISGYATLAMILRAMGYGKNGEFEGKGWEYQTAATAKQIGLIDNVMEAQLGSSAPRELVAEILFRALLTEMVDYTPLNGYVKNGKTLGYEKFKLEELEGVVVSNEYANLYGDSVEANDKTKLEVAADDIRSLNVGTKITDIGMRQHVYLTGSTVLEMTDKDLNNVTEKGEATDISSGGKFSSTAEMSQGAGTEFYVNFSTSGYRSSDIRIEYEMSLYLSEAGIQDYIDTARNLGSDYAWFSTNSNTAKLSLGAVTANALDPALNPNTYYSYVFHRVIPVSSAANLAANTASHITGFDMGNIQSIFYRSNGRGWTWDDGRVDSDKSTIAEYVGRVYVATQSTKDISDEISYNQFVETYIKPESYEINWNISGNGAWVKFIDNDKDGVCDYAFKTQYVMDKAEGSYTKGGETYIEYNQMDEGNPNYTIRYMDGYTPAVGDVVLAAWIDGQYLVEKANDVTKTVNNYNWKDDTITTTDGDTYGQSNRCNANGQNVNDVTNATSMQQLISTMDEKTEYIMYFDHFGYVRAYELPGGTQYALVTELYAKNNFNGNVISSTPMTVELTIGDADTKEYSVSGMDSAFMALAPWTEARSAVFNGNYLNWLQPAIAHLGVTRDGCGPVRAMPSFGTTTYQFWSGWNQMVKAGIVPGVTSDKKVSQEFNYGTQYIGANNAAQNNTVSFTNVAVVSNVTDTSAALKGAAQLKLNRAGDAQYWADGTAQYAVDYVQLDRTVNVAAKQTMYPISANYGGQSNKFVNATHDTEFYIVHNNGVEYFKDYEKMPVLDESNYIHAAYAVARDTSSDKDTAPYWVADVIVYEVRTWTDLEKTNISLAYFNQERSTGSVQLLKTLTNAKNGPMADLTPVVDVNAGTLVWGADRGSFGTYAGYGFYQLWNATEVVDGAMTARQIEKITSDFNAKGIYAGIVDRETAVAVNGGYITVMKPTATNTYKAYSVAVKDNVYTITSDNQLGGGSYNVAGNIRYTNLNSNQVQPGDLVIWLGGQPSSADWINTDFIVDLGNPDPTNPNWGLFNSTARFLLDRTWPASGYNDYNGDNGTYTTSINTNGSTPYADGDGLWQNIVSEQKERTDDISYNVIVERVLKDGTSKFSTVTLANGVLDPVSGSIDYNLLTTVIDTAGNTITPAGYLPVEFSTSQGTIQTVTIGGSGSVSSTPATTVTISGYDSTTNVTAATLKVAGGITGTVKVTIKYVSVGFTVANVGPTFGNGVQSIQAVNNTKGNSQNLSANGATKLTGANVGDTIQLNVKLTGPFDATTQDLVATVSFGGGTAKRIVDSQNVGEDSFHVTFTMEADYAEVNVEVVSKPRTITVSGAANSQIATVAFTNATVETAGDWTAETRWGGDVVIKLTKNTGYTLATPSVMADGEPMIRSTDFKWNPGRGEVTLLAGQGCDGKNVTVTFGAATAAEANLKFTKTTATPAASWRIGLPNGITDETSEILATVAGFEGTGIAQATGADTNVDVTVADTIYVLVIDGGTPTATGVTVLNGTTVANSGNNVVWKFVFDGSATDVVITVC